MGFPVNEDGTLDYTAAPTPTRLTDGAAEYGVPDHCPDCWGLTGDEQDYDGNEAACTCEYDEEGRRVLGDYAPALLMGDLISIRDAFAVQQAAAAVEAERARYNALKAVADSMAKAVRGVKADAVYQNGYEGNDYEYSVHIVDSDYTHELYTALAEYENVTDSAP